MMVIDAHAHIFTERSYAAYKKKAGGRVGKILSIHSSFPNDEGREIEVSLEEAFKFTSSKPDIALIGSVDMEKEVAPQLVELETFLRDKKIVGIKMYSGYQHFYPSDKEVFPVAELCQRHGVPLIFHSGDVDDSTPTSMLQYSHPLHIDALAVTYPACKIVISHFGFPYFLETANVVSKNKNVFTDISATLVNQDNSRDAENLLNQYIADLRRTFAYFPDVRRKVMFGTDYVSEVGFLNQVDPYFRLVEAVFTPDEQEQVLSKLAHQLYFGT